MKNHPNPTLVDEENPEWTEAMFNEATTAAELFPQLIKSVDNPKTGTTKIRTVIEYDADVVQAFRAAGDDWQARMNAALREWLQEHGV